MRDCRSCPSDRIALRAGRNELSEPIVHQRGPLQMVFDEAAAVVAELRAKGGVIREAENGVGDKLRIAGRDDHAARRALDEARSFPLADEKEGFGGCEDREELRGASTFIGGDIDERSEAAEGDGEVGGNLLERNGIAKGDIGEQKLLLELL